MKLFKIFSGLLLLVLILIFLLKNTEEVTMDVTQDYKLNLTTTITALGSIKATGAMTVGGSSISFN